MASWQEAAEAKKMCTDTIERLVCEEPNAVTCQSSDVGAGGLPVQGESKTATCALGRTTWSSVVSGAVSDAKPPAANRPAVLIPPCLRHPATPKKKVQAADLDDHRLDDRDGRDCARQCNRNRRRR